MGRAVLFCVVLAACAGCGPKQDLFPLAVGKHWSFYVRAGFQKGVEQVRVARALSVAGTRGYELSGPLGTSRLAWTDHGLVGERLINAQFSPPLPLLQSENGLVKPWTGTMILADHTSAPATAEQTQDPEKHLWGSHNATAVKSEVSIRSRGHTIVLTTWYVSGVGPIDQVQRTDEVQNLAATMLGQE